MATAEKPRGCYGLCDGKWLASAHVSCLLRTLILIKIKFALPKKKVVSSLHLVHVVAFDQRAIEHQPLRRVSLHAVHMYS